jgi:hypothetical protein
MGRLFEQISGEGDAAKKGKVVKKIVTTNDPFQWCHVGGPFQAGGISTSPAWA